MQSAIDTINYIGQNDSISEVYTTFAAALAAQEDKQKLMVSRGKWQEFIQPYLDLPAGDKYKNALAA